MKVLYLTSNGGIHDYRFLKKLVEDYEVLLLHYASADLMKEIIDLKNLKIISKSPFIKSFPLLSNYFHFKKCVLDFNPDIIHSGYVWQVGILASLMNFHPHLSMPWGSDILLEPQKNYLIKKLVNKTLQQCDHIQCDAEFVKKKMRNDYEIPEDKVTVFPWGIDLDLFKYLNKTECRKKLKIDENAFVVIFNRALEKLYGVEYLLKGFERFAKDKNNVNLVIISDGSMKNEVSEFIKSNALEDKITLMNRVANNELPLYLNSADIYVSTSLSDGTSLSLLEALASGTGIIVTDLPAIREWINDENGIIIRTEDSASISNALEKYYNNRELINRHAEVNLLIAKERCDWNKNYLKLKEIYNGLIKSGKKEN